MEVVVHAEALALRGALLPPVGTEGLKVPSSHPWALLPFWLLGSFPTPVSPVVSQWKDMLGTAFSLAIVGYVINLAMGRTLANKHGYDVPRSWVRGLAFYSC